jgi:secreted trypsin-like serine protease
MKATGYFARRPLWLVLALALAVALAAAFAAFGGAKPAKAAYYQPRIVGGTEVRDGKYPFMAALLDTRRGSSAYYQQFCGGALIDRDSVLTAAHCVYGESATPLRVAVGKTVLSSSQGQTRRVSAIFVHPSYNPNLDSRYDVAVLKLGSAVTGITPISLATSSQDSLETPGRSATVAGWGNTVAQPAHGSAGTSWPDRMREAQVPLVSDTTARSAYGGSFFPGLMVAAGKTGKDTCQGDSGGPMFANVSGRYTQIGVTSFGIGCGASGYPGVYAEVNASAIRNFITSAATR